MRRIGYDADTQTYTYRDDADGSIWEGPPGSRYGKLTQIEGPKPARRRTPPPSPPPLPPRKKDDSPRESNDQRSTRPFTDFGQVHQNEDRPVVRREDWRMLAPFLLLVCLFLLLIWHLLSGNTATVTH
jgi:hypothetical protein